jgi:hypothetical protein
MDRFTLGRLMGHSSPAVAAKYYIHVTEPHIAAGFGKFVEYQTRNVAEGLKAAFPQASKRSSPVAGFPPAGTLFQECCKCGSRSTLIRFRFSICQRSY